MTCFEFFMKTSFNADSQVAAVGIVYDKPK